MKMLSIVLQIPLLISSAFAATRLDIDCGENGIFNCHVTDPTIFTRCLEGSLYEFYCPDGLHFNTLTQTCDWPEAADCTYLIGANGDVSHQAAKKIKAQDGDDNEDSWVGENSLHKEATELPWWRPAGVDPKSWEDVDGIWESPIEVKGFVPEQPSRKKENEVDESDKESIKVKKSHKPVNVDTSSSSGGDLPSDKIWRPDLASASNRQGRPRTPSETLHHLRQLQVSTPPNVLAF
ncbi:hypothetical protein LOTGIDRAFT_228783 [Lottia gigantea]|uniref:Chitin-binding type-2 domain-containing protein n=1 Tax=Lottia gigantea TaxID=225164 RepID=V4A3J8_LOTGI|nr:hypothetical protein LOTGIDRAFT_228783 [Lottia gigantea]ESO91312.1 hypothetical protein LOTGIDRAFT_228783 [Lottia gigantea]